MNWRTTKIQCAAAAITLATVAMGHADTRSSCTDDPVCLQALHAAQQVRNVKYWRAFQKLPIDRRVLVAPKKLLDYLILDNQLNGFPNRPHAAQPLRPFLQDMADAIREMPPAVIALVDQKLMGIFLVQDLGGTGFTDYVFNDQDEPVGAFVVLDVGVLTRAANAWASWKENTPFLDDPDFVLQATIEHEDQDNRKQALQYILLHELGHVASAGADFHPRWDAWDCASRPPADFPFFQLSWQLEDPAACHVVSKFDQKGFENRTSVVYYFGARLPGSASPQIYAQLAKTNFPSLYSATSPADDFAESFVTYVHTVLMSKPFEIRIDEKGVRLNTFNGCWGTERCASKQRMMEELFSHRNP